MWTGTDLTKHHSGSEGSGYKTTDCMPGTSCTEREREGGRERESNVVSLCV